MSEESKEIGVRTYYHEYDDNKESPTIIIDIPGEFDIAFDLDLSNNTLSRTCICYAHSNSECLCGAWEFWDAEEQEK
tara:strand:- start:213 stop:443 length:231 start_codon:yes stop_codon:yes gene_type:complete